MDVIPMTYGDVNAIAGKKLDGFKIAKILKKHVVSPDMSHATEKYVLEELKAVGVNEFITAIMKASGMGDKVDVETDAEGVVTITEKNE